MGSATLLWGGELEGGDDGAVIGAGARTDFARTTNEVFAIKDLVDGNSKEGVIALPSRGVASSPGAVHQFGGQRAETGGVGGAIKVADDDDGGGAGVNFFRDSFDGCFVRAGVAGTAGREGVGVDQVQFAILELNASADVGSAVLTMGIDDGAENGVFGIEKNAEVVATRMLDDVRVISFEGGQGCDPLLADFLQENVIGIVFLNEGQDVGVTVIEGEDVEGENFELGAGSGAVIFSEGEVVATERLQLDEEKATDHKSAFGEFAEEQDEEEDGKSDRAGEAKVGQEVEGPMPSCQEHRESEDCGHDGEASKDESKERSHFRGVLGCFDWQGGNFRPEL